jgi:ribosomal protein S18 acetylase RimI-like enzyme
MMLLQDPGSMFLNALAVSAGCRRLGVGTQLLQWAQGHTQDRGFSRLSLHVWSDNTRAIDFYKAQGFVELATAPVDPHPRLPHRGGSVLMRRTIADDAAPRA